MDFPKCRIELFAFRTFVFSAKLVLKTPKTEVILASRARSRLKHQVFAYFTLKALLNIVFLERASSKLFDYRFDLFAVLHI